MPLNKTTGNMYDWITHTWNPIKGECPHECTYCYMKKIYKRFSKEPSPPHLVASELHTNLGSGNTIFVCSSIDLFAEDIPLQWINKVVYHADSYPNNTYVWHTKNPRRTVEILAPKSNYILCVTLETDYFTDNVLHSRPNISRRLFDGVGEFEGSKFLTVKFHKFKKMITVEPIMDFDLINFLDMICTFEPIQVNIGADSGHNHLPEPPKEKVIQLIAELKKFTKVVEKKNLRRLVD